MKIFTRQPLAKELAESIMGKKLFSDGPNGLFLAAPRRTGKSTFLQFDLKPELEAQGVFVIYVDLWSEQSKDTDPTTVISIAIERAVKDQLGRITKAAKKAGLESVTLGSVLKFGVKNESGARGMSYFEALQQLSESVKRPVALIIDEAQHALTSEQGESAMKALKSARDQMNTPDKVNLMLVMSGSDRDKLLRLVNSNATAFYGSQVKNMPLLDTDFVAHIRHLIEAQRPDLIPIDPAQLMKAFVLFGHRPQVFAAALEHALSPLEQHTDRFETTLMTAALARQKDDEAQMASEFSSLEKIEQAVITRILSLGAKFRPYDADTLCFVSSATGKRATTTQVQNALVSLRAREPSMIWKSARGEYAIDDTAMTRWYETEVKAGRWPPTPTPDAESALASRF